MRTSCFLYVTFLTLACGGHASFTRISDVQPAPRGKDCHLDIYQSDAEVSQPFEKICLVTGTSGAKATLDEALGPAKERACECGAQALVINSTESSGNRFVGIKINLTATGIIYKGERGERR